MINYGLIPEFIGRLPVIATLDHLDKEALVKILQEPRNALTKQYKRLFEIDGIALFFTPDALEVVAEKALERKTGARGLRSILETSMLDLMYELPSREGVEEVWIDADVINRLKEPTVHMRQDIDSPQAKFNF